MGAKLQSRWRRVKQRRVTIIVTTAIIVVAVALIIVGYLFDWSGFTGYTQVSTVHTVSGPAAGTITRNEAFQPGKTLWDWMQLLFIPLVLAVAGFWFNHNERKAAELRAENDRKAAELRADADREISLDNQREAALTEYIDKMSELLLHENLRKSVPEDEVRMIARLRTLTVLDRLDGKRKGNVLKFLKDSELINDGDNTVIFLSGANLRGAYLRKADFGYTSVGDQECILPACLRWVDLSEADLSGTHLERINLQFANLTRADLSSAMLEGASLRRADLTEADLHNANLMSVDLRNANLTGANLTNAELSLNPGEEWDYKRPFGADLSYANLSSVIGITVEELKKSAVLLKGAIMPDGSKHS